jgi:hypothetical protein
MVQPILFVTSRHCIGILSTCTCGMDVVNKIKILTFSTQQQAKEMINLSFTYTIGNVQINCNNQSITFMPSRVSMPSSTKK